MRRYCLLLCFPIILPTPALSAACNPQQDCPPMSANNHLIADNKQLSKSGQTLTPPTKTIIGNPVKITKQASQSYVVKNGDSLSVIGLRNSRNYQDIARWNRLSPPYKIMTGQKLKLFDPRLQQKKLVKSDAANKPVTDIRPSVDKTALVNKTPSRKQPASTEKNRIKKLPPVNGQDGIHPAATPAPSMAKKIEFADKNPPGKLLHLKPENAAKEMQHALKKNSPPEKTPLLSASRRDTADKNAQSPAGSVNQQKKTDIKQKKAIISINNKKMLKLNFKWPVKGIVVKNFSEAHNKGIEIAGKQGKQPVSAAEAGLVVYQGQGLTSLRNLIIIKHNDEYLSAYANNSRLLVSEGQQVSQGQIIAEMGDETETIQKPLHFEIRKNGNPVNPLDFLPK